MPHAPGHLQLSKSALLSLTFACAPIACSGGHYAGSERSSSRMLENPSAPEATVDRLTECANRGSIQFTDTNYAVMFDVEATESGEVREAKIKDSMLGDSDMESCMVRALGWRSPFTPSVGRRRPHKT